MADETVSLRRSLTWGLVAFGVVLAAIIGVRLDQAALTIVVGVGCGLGATIPASLLLVALLHRRNENRENRKQRLMAQSPPVIVVTPHASPQISQAGSWPDEFTLPQSAQRQFSVIGEEEVTDL